LNSIDEENTADREKLSKKLLEMQTANQRRKT
jgi:hypothetical protein